MNPVPRDFRSRDQWFEDTWIGNMSHIYGCFILSDTTLFYLGFYSRSTQSINDAIVL